MGTRTKTSQRQAAAEATVSAGHSHGGPDKQLNIDASRVIARLRTQRTDLENQLDFVTVALEESQEREQGMLARIAELEDKYEPKEAAE